MTRFERCVGCLFIIRFGFGFTFHQFDYRSDIVLIEIPSIDTIATEGTKISQNFQAIFTTTLTVPSADF